MNEISKLLDRVITLHRNYEPEMEKDIQQIYDLLKVKISKETNSEVIIEALNRDISDLLYLNISFMFEMYQRAIELDPMNENVILNFVEYVDIHSGPDWEEEVSQIRALLSNNKIDMASKVALQINYNKWN